MRAAITGTARGTGRCLVHGLLDLGHAVRGIDLRRPDEQCADRMVVANIAIETTRLVDEVVSGADAVFHLAATVGEIDGQDRTRASHWSSRALRDAARFRRRGAPDRTTGWDLGATDLTTRVTHGGEVVPEGAVWG